LLAKRGREFFSGREFDLVLNTVIVGKYDSAPRGVFKKTDDRRVGTTYDANDATLGAASAGNSREAIDSSDDMIAMHGVFNVIAGDEKVSVDIGDGYIGNYKAVAVLMKDQAASNLVSRSSFVLGNILAGRSGAGLRFLISSEQEPPVRKFLDQAAFL
jgi:hypothetical protein